MANQQAPNVGAVEGGRYALAHNAPVWVGRCGGYQAGLRRITGPLHHSMHTLFYMLRLVSDAETLQNNQ